MFSKIGNNIRVRTGFILSSTKTIKMTRVGPLWDNIIIWMSMVQRPHLDWALQKLYNHTDNHHWLYPMSVGNRKLHNHWCVYYIILYMCLLIVSCSCLHILLPNYIFQLQISSFHILYPIIINNSMIL